MPKCLNCNNEETFIVSYVGWDKLYFSPGDDNAYDSKSLSTSLDVNQPPECAECNSTNVEGDF